MRVDTMKRQIDLHAWVGIVAGLALFVAFFAGAINMFHHELHHWQEPWEAAESNDANMQALLDTVIARNPEAGNWLFLIPGDEPAAIWQERVDGEAVWHTEHAATSTMPGRPSSARIRSWPGSSTSCISSSASRRWGCT